jgi:penicillin amidase
LAELIGEDGLVIDRLSRRLGFQRAAQGHYQAIDSSYQKIFTAFGQGISDGAHFGCPKPAHAFTLLRSQPTPWTALDVLASLNYIGFVLSTWSAKLARWKIYLEDGPEALKALDPAYAEWLPVTKPVNAPAGEALDHLGQDLMQLSEMIGFQGGSNNWAIQSSQTSTGRPLLANDPHLAPTLPCPWYLVQIETPELKVGGASFIGAPIIPSGHNEVAAWGVTAGLIDNIDLFIEEIDKEKQIVREGDAFVPCQVLSETYHIKGQELFEEEILITPRGPIISDVLEGDLGTLSIRATWMTPRPANGFVKFHYARDFESFREACREIFLASQNLVYADIHDNIGWQLVGEVPSRGETWGTVPLPGWKTQFQWDEQNIPWEEIPHLLNPPTGFVATANNKPLADDEGPYLGRDFVEYRQTRILELLGERGDWDLSSTQDMQLDQFSVPWQEVRDIILAVPVKGEAAQLAQQSLASWNGVISKGSASAAIYEYFGVSMIQRMARAKAPNSTSYALNQGFHPMILRTFFGMRAISHLVRLLRVQPDGWFANGWDAEIESALAEAVDKLREELGSDPVKWSWGQVHPLILEHPLGSRAPLDKIFNRGPFPTGGDHDTIAQAGRLASQFHSNVIGLANLRAVHDIGNWDDNRFVICGGQSGNPFSPHYDDLLQIWLRGETITMAWSEASIQRVTKQTLRLMPQKKNCLMVQ